MNHKLFCLLCVILGAVSLNAQDKWDLRRCVEYAIEHNISVKQADIQSRVSALTIKLQKAGLYPNLNFSGSVGYNFGRSINPATNIFQNDQVLFNNYQLQSSVTIFNWFSQRYAVEASKLEKEAADAAVSKARDDIALNVAVAYLQTLMANEQIQVSNVQIQQTVSQLDLIQKRVSAGVLPELNLIEIQAQLARDSATFITSQSTFQQNLIQLKALLNLDMSVAFNIETPNVNAIPVEPLASLQPDYVYQMALQNLPQQKANQLRYQSALKNIQSARASMYPSISAFAGVGSSYSPRYPDQTKAVVTRNPGYDTLNFVVESSPGVFKPVLAPDITSKVPFATFGKQVFDVTLGQRVGLNLSVPIFNNRQLKTNWERSKLNAESIQLQLSQDNLSLQADVYNAYTNAVNAQQRYTAAQKAVQASQKALDFSQKRYDAGLLSVFELITNQNNLTRAKLDVVTAQFEYVFRMKLLEFYKGQGLKL
jgi:outer membrane protein